VPGIVVVKAALTDALWELGSEPSPDVLCVANSTFKFTSQNSLMIQKNLEKTDYNSSDTVIVGSINIDMPEGAIGRAAECGSGHLRYIVTSSKKAPTDIEITAGLNGRQDLRTVAKHTPTSYPRNCEVTAHFERSGYVADDIIEPDENHENDENEFKEDEFEDQPGEEKQDIEPYFEPEPSNVYSIVLVIDSYDCSNSTNDIPTRKPGAPAANPLPSAGNPNTPANKAPSIIEQ
jgi:hypothetical protein